MAGRSAAPARLPAPYPLAIARDAVDPVGGNAVTARAAVDAVALAVAGEDPVAA
jgi:hypothetical protein